MRQQCTASQHDGPVMACAQLSHFIEERGYGMHPAVALMEESSVPPLELQEIIEVHWPGSQLLHLMEGHLYSLGLQRIIEVHVHSKQSFPQIRQCQSGHSQARMCKKMAANTCGTMM